MKKQIHNLQTGEISWVDYTQEEIEQMEADAIRLKNILLQRDSEFIALQNKKLETLSKLGITEEEAKLLLS